MGYHPGCIAAIVSAHLSLNGGFAIRRREPNPSMDGRRHPQPRQDPPIPRNACDRHDRRRRVSRRGAAGWIDLRRHARGRRRRDAGTDDGRAGASDPGGAGHARHFAGLADVAAIAATCRRLSLDHRPVGARNLLHHLRLQFLSAARPWLGPHHCLSRCNPGRPVADCDIGDRKRRRHGPQSRWCRPCA